MEHSHVHMHRRQARDAFPNPLAIASAAADAFASAFPNPFADPEPDPDPQTTLVSVVYVTAAKTFEGPVGGYTTLGVPGTTEEATPTTHFQVRPTATDSSPIVVDTAAPTRSKSSTASTTSRTSLSNGLPASIVPTTSVASSLAIFVATSSPSKPTISPTASSAESTSSVSKSGGMGAGGKAALAIGILLLFGTALAITLFFLKKRKNAMRAERLDDEKTDTFAGAGRAASTRTAVTAPRLSLRPVTQFLPNLGGDKYATRGNVLAMSSTPISRPTDPRKNGSAWDRPMLSQDSNTNNPFGSHAETIDSTNAKGPAVTGSTGPGGQTVPRATAAAATAGAYGLARGASKRENQAKQIDFTNNGPYRSPPSPVGTDFSQASDTYGSPNQTRQGAAISAAGGLANSAVHRVQLDFKPSMEDELELRAGQLIRLLHEYDDGWALCIRLDRSQQGVVPRTCLSTRPVKPRPQQNGPRGPAPAGIRGPQQGRPMSPAMNQGAPRGMSPASNQKMISQPARPRSPSAAQRPGPRSSPPANGAIARKTRRSSYVTSILRLG